MTTTAISKTKIATSDPVNICQGFAFFPLPGDKQGETHRNFPLGWNPTWVLWSNSWNIIGCTLSTNGDLDVDMGICGPAYGFKSVISGNLTDNAVQIQVEEDEMNAGFFFGFGGALRGTASIKIPFVGTFSTPPSGIVIDVISLILSRFVDLSTTPVGKFVPSLIRPSGYALFGSAKGSFSTSGQMAASPTFSLPIDLVTLYKPLEDLVEAFNSLTMRIGLKSRFTFGPVIGFQLPITLKVDNIWIDDAKFGGFTFDTESKFLKGSLEEGVPPSYPENLTVYLKHAISFGISIGISGGLGIEKLCFISIGISYAITSLMNLPADLLGSYVNPVRNSIGNLNVASCGCGDIKDANLVDVIFEPVESAV